MCIDVSGNNEESEEKNVLSKVLWLTIFSFVFSLKTFTRSGIIGPFYKVNFVRSLNKRTSLPQQFSEL